MKADLTASFTRRRGDHPAWELRADPGRLSGAEVVEAISVPPPGAGVCAICRVWTGGWRTCWSCRRVSRLLSGYAAPIFPASLGTKDPLSALSCPVRTIYSALKAYKALFLSCPEQASRSVEAELLRLVLLRHLEANWGELERGAGHTILAAVPSSRGRSGLHPLEVLLGGKPHVDIGEPYVGIPVVRRLLRCEKPVERRAPSAHQEAPVPIFRSAPLEPLSRVLLVEDALASGLRAQAAAKALLQAGAESVVIVAIVRLLGSRALRFGLERSALHTFVAQRRNVASSTPFRHRFPQRHSAFLDFPVGF